MVYIVLAVVALFCFLFCFLLLKNSKSEPVKEKHRPAWQDEDADEEQKTISYRSGRRVRNVEDKSTPWRRDPPEEEATYDAIFEEEPEETVYDLSEGREVPAAPQKNSPAEKRDSSVPVKYQKSVLLRTLETLCGILFVIAMALLILDIYLKGIR